MPQPLLIIVDSLNSSGNVLIKGNVSDNDYLKISAGKMVLILGHKYLI